MLLPRAIIFTCLVYFTQELHLSKRGIEDSVSTTQDATDHVPENSTKPATVRSEIGHAHFASENASEHVNSKNHVYSNPVNASELVEPKEAYSESQHTSNKSESDLNNIQSASANATEYTAVSETTSEYISHRSKREVENVNSASENPTKQATVSENASKHASNKAKSEEDHIHSASENVTENAVESVSERVTNNSKNELGNVQLGSATEHAVLSKNASEHAIDKSKKDVHVAQSVSENITEHVAVIENVSEHAANRSKREVTNVHSASENATEHPAQAGEASANADVVSEKSAVKTDEVSERSAVKADAVSEISAVNALTVSEKSADSSDVNIEAVSENATQVTSPVEPNLNLPVNGRRNNMQSKWCQNLKNCQPNKIEICGYDEKAGFAKFTDFCHLMEVNCYWGHDFTLHACKAMQLKQMGRPLNVFNK